MTKFLVHSQERIFETNWKHFVGIYKPCKNIVSNVLMRLSHEDRSGTTIMGVQKIGVVVCCRSCLNCLESFGVKILLIS